MDKTGLFVLYLAVFLEPISGSLLNFIMHRNKRETCNPNDEFTCISGQCIQTFNICDGTKECFDGSDETSVVCQRLNITCPSRTFKCAYGACIDGDKVCDRVKDCADGSDEDTKLCIDSPPPSSVTSCGKHEFRCNSGQCTSAFNVCDGFKHCSDGSDETSAICSSISCPKLTFRCNYGACISNELKCNFKADCADGSDEDVTLCQNVLTPSSNIVTTTTARSPQIPYPLPSTLKGGCTLPEPPENGRYSSPLCQSGDNSATCKQIPGTIVPKNWLLSFACNRGYVLPENYIYAVCLDGKWSPYLATCTKLCPKLTSLSLRVTCKFQGADVDCNEPMMPKTTAKAECNVNYNREYSPRGFAIECQEDGRWSDHLFYCRPDCGRANYKNDELLISNGSSTEYGEYPWAVGLYKINNTGQYEQFCGGTLISPHLVLTAAHCVYNEYTRKTDPASEFKIGLGKYYREWDKAEIGAEKRDVREIMVPDLYEGRKSSYALDVALIDLAVSVRVTTYIMPACIDWEYKFLLTPGMYGTLTGFGKTEKEEPSAVLLTASLPYIERRECREKVPGSFQRFITPDKFCAGFQNGTGARKGDSGSGLTFIHKDGLHRVYGVVSSTVKDQNSYAAYTNVTNVEILQWLDLQQRRLDSLHLHES